MISPRRAAIKGRQRRRASPAGMDKTMTGFRLTILLLTAAVALGGCGRKNLPVAPSRAARSVGEPGSTDDNAPASVANFQRAGRVTADGDLTISPAEVSRNPKAAGKSFPLDFLLN